MTTVEVAAILLLAAVLAEVFLYFIIKWGHDVDE